MTHADEHRTVGESEPAGDEPETPDLPVTAHRSCPERTVFTEEGNTDAWIATDLTVSVER